MRRSQTATAARAASSSNGKKRVVLPLEEIYPLYPGEWVLVKAVECDERGSIARAEVLIHSRSRKKVSEVLIRVHQDEPGVRTYIFPGGDYIFPEGDYAATAEKWREALAEAARDPQNAFW